MNNNYIYYRQKIIINKKTLIAILLNILLFFLFSCSTDKSPLSTGEKNFDPFTNEQLSPHVIISKNEKMNTLFNKALKAGVDQDWNAVIDYLIEGAKIDPAGESSTFIKYLQKMLFPPFPTKRVCTVLSQINPSYFRSNQPLIKLLKQAPMSLQWNQKKTVLTWLKPQLFSILGVFFASNLPIVEVIVNGTPMRMGLDTGFTITFLFRDAAKKVGVDNISGKNFNINITDGGYKTRSGSLALIKSMKLGSLEVKNCLSMIAKRPFGLDAIDGFIGWPVLSQLVMKMDAKNEKITLSASDAVLSKSENFFWFGEPIIRVTGKDSSTMLFFSLDTGARRTSFSDSGIALLNANAKKAEISLGIGIHGIHWNEKSLIESAEIYLNKYQIKFIKHKNSPMSFGFLQHWDGVLGSDIAQSGTVTFDFLSGQLLYEPY